jgi:hypothetical protein
MDVARGEAANALVEEEERYDDVLADTALLSRGSPARGEAPMA